MGTGDFFPNIKQPLFLHCMEFHLHIPYTSSIYLFIYLWYINNTVSNSDHDRMINE
jgi:hypothetical protein